MDIWNRCVEKLKEELPYNQIATWIMPLQPEMGEGGLRLFAPNRFVMNWVKDNYLTRLTSIFQELSGSDSQEISLSIGSRSAPKTKTSSEFKRGFTAPGSDQTFEQRLADGNINPRYSFDLFVEGKSNQIAKAASIQVSLNPGKVYNPLFIYGGTGLGKTHLMHALGYELLRKDPGFRVLYIDSNRFVQDMVTALRHNKMDEFKSRYRSVNALLIDDVQLFAGKDRTQEEFFHTFNILFESQQQIVLSSDRFPKEVSGLEERLKSRFGWGLTVAIEPPDIETRVAILQSKACALGMDLPQEVAFFIGKRIRSNVRELEGALARLKANSQFTGSQISLDFTRDALRDLFVAQDKQITLDNIKKVVAEFFSLQISDLTSANRSRSLARPRQMAMALAKDLTSHSLPEIGKAFGGRDHTTVMHATKKITELRLSDPNIDDQYTNLLRKLTN